MKLRCRAQVAQALLLTAAVAGPSKTPGAMFLKSNNYEANS
jgi:hypothetical protein